MAINNLIFFSQKVWLKYHGCCDHIRPKIMVTRPIYNPKPTRRFIYNS